MVMKVYKGCKTSRAPYHVLLLLHVLQVDVVLPHHVLLRAEGGGERGDHDAEDDVEHDEHLGARARWGVVSVCCGERASGEGAECECEEMRERVEEGARVPIGVWRNRSATRRTSRASRQEETRKGCVAGVSTWANKARVIRKRKALYNYIVRGTGKTQGGVQWGDVSLITSLAGGKA